MTQAALELRATPQLHFLRTASSINTSTGFQFLTTYKSLTELALPECDFLLVNVSMKND
jgi:hypothetical protein